MLRIGLALALVGFLGAAATFVVRRAQNGLFPRDTSAYSKCNGLDEVQRLTTGGIPVHYQLLDKRYTCRGFQGNTPQRVTEITYVYGLPGAARQSAGRLHDDLADELRRAGWVAPGVATIDGHTTALHLSTEPLIGLDYEGLTTGGNIVQLTVFARDSWHPATKQPRAPPDLVATVEQAQPYADYTMYTPGFIPPGYTGWQLRPLDNSRAFDADGLKGATWTLTGGDPVVRPTVHLSRASISFGAGCAQLCKEEGRTADGNPVSVSDDGNSVFGLLGDTHVTVDQLTNFNARPAVGTAAGVAILNPLRAR